MKNFTASDLVQTPTHVYQMSLQDCEEWLTTHNNLRKKPIPEARVYIKAQQARCKQSIREQDKAARELRKLEKIAETNEARIMKSASKVLDTIEAMHVRVRAISDEPDRALELISRHGRSYSSDVHDYPMVHTGFESKDSLAMRAMDGYSPCKEHFHPRQWVGEQLVLAVLSGEVSSLKDLAHYVYKYSHVHYVTPEENRRLMKFQKSNVFMDWETSYELANIDLVSVKDKHVHDGWERALEIINDAHELLMPVKTIK